MTTILAVPPPELTSLGSRLSAEADRLESVLLVLDQRVAALLGSWSGEAQAAFREAYAAWRAEAGELRGALDAAAQAAGATAEAFDVAESDNVARWPF